MFWFEKLVEHLRLFIRQLKWTRTEPRLALAGLTLIAFGLLFPGSKLATDFYLTGTVYAYAPLARIAHRKPRKGCPSCYKWFA